MNENAVDEELKEVEDVELSERLENYAWEQLSEYANNFILWHMGTFDFDSFIKNGKEMFKIEMK